MVPRSGTGKHRFIFQIVQRGSALLVVLLCLPGCFTKRQTSPVLALVNGEKITVSHYQIEMDRNRWKYGSQIGMDPEERKKIQKRVMDSLLRDCLLLQEAAKRKIKVSSDEIHAEIAKYKRNYTKAEDFEKFLRLRGSTIDDFKEQRVRELKIKKLVQAVTEKSASVTQGEAQSYYHEHLNEFQHPEQIHVRQIVSNSKEKAQALREMILNGHDFAEVARNFSISPDKENGGDLGWFGKGVMPKEFDRVCFRLPLKQLSRVIQTPYGYHIFEVLERRGAGQFPLDQVEDQIVRKLKEGKAKSVFQSWYKGVKARAEIAVKTSLLETL